MTSALAEHTLEEHERGRVVLVGPGVVCVEALVELFRSESFEVVAESLEDAAVSSGLGFGSTSGAGRLGHAASPWVACRDRLGSASYIASSCGSVRLSRDEALQVAHAIHHPRGVVDVVRPGDQGRLLLGIELERCSALLPALRRSSSMLVDHRASWALRSSRS
jgi:hypothetical protein